MNQVILPGISAEKQQALDWVINTLKRTPLPISPREAALNNAKTKQPGYYDGKYFKTLTWGEYQDWGSIKDDIKKPLINLWHSGKRIEGIACNAGWNGEYYLGFVDIDLKNFSSPEAMEQVIKGWENRHPELSIAPKIKTQSGGYRYVMGFEKIPPNWNNTINFTFTPEGEHKLGELMVGVGALGILPPTKGIKGDYIWAANAYAAPPVFESPDKIELFEVVKKIEIKSIYDNNPTDSSEQAREWLECIPPSYADDYQSWVDIGMACHAAGLDVSDWDKWSQANSKYKPGECEKKWKSFNNSGGITAGTLYHYAKENGWEPPKNERRKKYQQAYRTQGNAALKSEPESLNKRKKASEIEIFKALKDVENILLDTSIDEISQEIKINQIKEDLGIDWKLWDKLRSKINKKIRGNQLELELKSLLIIDEKIKITQAIHDLSEKYRMSIHSINELLKELKARTTTPQFESVGLDELFDEVSDAIDYLVPGLLPKGESAILAASPKVGKSLLAVDLAFAVATGEDYFLNEKTQTGRVLYVSVDESKQSVKSKLIKRGFRKYDAPNIKIITQFCINQLSKLEAEIEEFKPALVIIDSLKRITKGLEISENSAEFADNIYTISELCNRYGASCLLIHHTNKNTESTGVENVRGSSAIAGALGNVWVLNRIPSKDPNNKKKMIFDPKDPRRQIYCYSRDSEGKAYNLEFNPENNSWAVAGQVGVSEDEAINQKTAKDRILSILRANLPHHPEGLCGSFIYECLELEQPGGMPKSTMYVNLNRLTEDKIIGSKPAPGNKRYSLYFLHGYGQQGQGQPNPIHTTNQPQAETQANDYQNGRNRNIPPLPPVSVSNCNPNSKTTIDKDLEVSYMEKKVSYTLVTSKSCNHTPVTSCIDCSEGGVTELVTASYSEGGGGFPIENSANPEESRIYTTTPLNTTKLADDKRPPEPQPQTKLQPQPAPQPVKGCVYLDAEGYPHKIKGKDDKGIWRDHKGEPVTPGIFRTYKPWSLEERESLMNAVNDAAFQLQSGDATAIESLRQNPVTKAQMNMARNEIKKQIGEAKWQIIQDYLKGHNHG